MKSTATAFNCIKYQSCFYQSNRENNKEHEHDSVYTDGKFRRR